MDRDANAGGPIVTGFGAGGFRVGDVYLRAVLLTVDAASDWSPPALAALDITALQALVASAPEFILLGTGARLQRPPAALVQALEAQDIGLEPMDSRAAARAWGVLRGEGRHVAAALYPVE